MQRKPRPSFTPDPASLWLRGVWLAVGAHGLSVGVPCVPPHALPDVLFEINTNDWYSDEDG